MAADKTPTLSTTNARSVQAVDEPIPIIKLATPGVKTITITVKETLTPGQVQFQLQHDGFAAPMGNATLARCEIKQMLLQALITVNAEETQQQALAMQIQLQAL